MLKYPKNFITPATKFLQIIHFFLTKASFIVEIIYQSVL